MIKIFKTIFRQIKSLCALLYYLLLPYNFGLSERNLVNNEPQVIVSLTSYPDRFATLHLVLKSIMNQTVKPNKIILYLDDYVKYEDLTKEMIKLQSYGLSIMFRGLDIKSHKKYYHAMKEYSNDIIITIDDDCIYQRNLIETLLKCHKKYPEAICARRCHEIIFDEKGKPYSYIKWNMESKRYLEPCMKLVATGVGGVLYPPRCLPEIAFDVEMIKNLALYQDDLWLKYVQIYNQIYVVWDSEGMVLPFTVQLVQGKNSLRNRNIGREENDKALHRLEQQFKPAWQMYF